MIDNKTIKLSVYAVLGEGNKLIFDVPEGMQEAIDVKAGDVIDIEQLVLWHDISKAYRKYSDCPDDNATASIRIPSKLAKRLDLRRDGSVCVAELLQFMQGEPATKSAISEADRENLYDAIYNPDRAITDPKRR